MSANGKTETLTPKQEAFLAAYLDNTKPTFGNALQSALKAGYSQEYAESITHKLPDWLAEKVGKLEMLKKAEKTLNKTLDYDCELDGKVDTSLLRIQSDVAKFLAETAGNYVKKSQQDITSGGEPLKNINVVKHSGDTTDQETNPSVGSVGESEDN